MPESPSSGVIMPIATRRSGASNGSFLIRIVFMIVKAVLVAAMPTASVTMTSAVKPALRRIVRRLNWMSLRSASTHAKADAVR